MVSQLSGIGLYAGWLRLTVWLGVLGFFFFSSRRRHTRLVSDWSSDVCSSDLHRAIRARGRRGGPGAGVRRRARGPCRAAAGAAGGRAFHHRRRPRRPAPGRAQIGRASCRERGEISGGGGSLQEKGEHVGGGGV